MPDATDLYLFVIAAMLLLIVPGPNMAFITSHALAHGKRAGIAAALGISFADLMMTALVSTGLGALVMSWSPAFELLRWAGAGYLLWLAWQALKTPASAPGAQRPLTSLRTIFARATLNSLLNPKALLFFMVFLPQFVNVGAGGVTLQLLVLGVLLSAIALIFHTALALFAGLLRMRLDTQSRWARLGAYGFAGVMAALAARLVFLQRP